MELDLDLRILNLVSCLWYLLKAAVSSLCTSTLVGHGIFLILVWRKERCGGMALAWSAKCEDI